MPRIYAATSDTEGYFRVLGAADYPYVLSTYAYPNALERLVHAPTALLTDSGAFTVWQKGEKVDLAAYIAWCHERRQGGPADQVHISLDVIPGERGKQPTKRQIKAAMRKSLANGDKMREAGLPVMEVYHQGEPPEFLDELIDRLAPGDVLGISPRQGRGPSMDARSAFCEGVFAHLLERHGKHLPKAHGLGVTGRSLIFKFPWWSVDSLSWTAPGVWGRVQGRDSGYRIDARLRGRPNYREAKCREVLEIWRCWNRELESLWEKRGVTWRE
jgi:hypothetical protein